MDSYRFVCVCILLVVIESGTSEEPSIDSEDYQGDNNLVYEGLNLGKKDLIPEVTDRPQSDNSIVNLLSTLHYPGADITAKSISQPRTSVYSLNRASPGFSTVTLPQSLLGLSPTTQLLFDLSNARSHLYPDQRVSAFTPTPLSSLETDKPHFIYFDPTSSMLARTHLTNNNKLQKLEQPGLQYWNPNSPAQLYTPYQASGPAWYSPDAQNMGYNAQRPLTNNNPIPYLQDTSTFGRASVLPYAHNFQTYGLASSTQPIRIEGLPSLNTRLNPNGAHYQQNFDQYEDEDDFHDTHAESGNQDLQSSIASHIMHPLFSPQYIKPINFDNKQITSDKLIEKIHSEAFKEKTSTQFGEPSNNAHYLVPSLEYFNPTLESQVTSLQNKVANIPQPSSQVSTISTQQQNILQPRTVPTSRDAKFNLLNPPVFLPSNLTTYILKQRNNVTTEKTSLSPTFPDPIQNSNGITNTEGYRKPSQKDFENYLKGIFEKLLREKLMGNELGTPESSNELKTSSKQTNAFQINGYTLGSINTENKPEKYRDISRHQFQKNNAKKTLSIPAHKKNQDKIQVTKLTNGLTSLATGGVVITAEPTISTNISTIKNLQPVAPLENTKRNRVPLGSDTPSNHLSNQLLKLHGTPSVRASVDKETSLSEFAVISNLIQSQLQQPNGVSNNEQTQQTQPTSEEYLRILHQILLHSNPQNFAHLRDYQRPVDHHYDAELTPTKIDHSANLTTHLDKINSAHLPQSSPIGSSSVHVNKSPHLTFEQPSSIHDQNIHIDSLTRHLGFGGYNIPKTYININGLEETPVWADTSHLFKPTPTADSKVPYDGSYKKKLRDKFLNRMKTPGARGLHAPYERSIDLQHNRLVFKSHKDLKSHGITGGITINCTDGFNNLGSSCLHVSANKYPWQEANTYCNNLGASLVYSKDKAEDDILSDYLKSRGLEKGWSAYSHDITEKGIVVHLDQDRNMHPGEFYLTPFPETIHQVPGFCLAPTRASNFYYSPENCTSKIPAICRKDPPIHDVLALKKSLDNSHSNATKATEISKSFVLS